MVEYPKVNEVVVCKIHKITDYGVFVELLEYDNIEGFIHLSQISSTWVKNIHNHVKLNQIRGAKVLSIDKSKNHIDLSFNRVSNADEKRKISDYRLFKRALGLMNVIAGELKVDNDECWSLIADPILEKENNLYTGFVNLVRYGPEYYSSLDENYAKQVIEILSKNITVKDKKITGLIEASCDAPDGVEVIKKVLTKVESEKIKIFYLGPGRYEITVNGKDYKIASKEFKKTIEDIQKGLKGYNCKITQKDKKS